MTTELSRDGTVARGALWFGLMGGAVAWLAHFLAAWLIAEFGCIMAAGRPPVAFISTTAVLLIVATVICLAAALAATVVGHRAGRSLREEGAGSDDRVSYFMAKGGAISSGLFAFFIAVQSIPIFFFLDHC
jgi:hypothetical protein